MHYYQGKYQARKWNLQEKLTVHKVGYPGESDMPGSDMRGSTVDEKTEIGVPKMYRKIQTGIWKK